MDAKLTREEIGIIENIKSILTFKELFQTIKTLNPILTKNYDCIDVWQNIRNYVSAVALRESQNKTFSSDLKGHIENYEIEHEFNTKEAQKYLDDNNALKYIIKLKVIRLTIKYNKIINAIQNCQDLFIIIDKCGIIPGSNEDYDNLELHKWIRVILSNRNSDFNRITRSLGLRDCVIRLNKISETLIQSSFDFDNLYTKLEIISMVPTNIEELSYKYVKDLIEAYRVSKNESLISRIPKTFKIQEKAIELKLKELQSIETLKENRYAA